MSRNCHRCVFAEFDKNRAQNGCKLGMLQKFIGKGFDIQSEVVYEPVPDKEGEVLERLVAVPQTICRKKRGPEWAEFHKDCADLDGQIAKENSLAHAFIVVFDPDKEYKEEEISRTLHSIATQTLPSNEFTVLVREKHRFPTVILGTTGMKWRRVCVYENEFPVYEHIRRILSKIDAYFYTLVEPGFEVPTDFVEKLDAHFNHEFKQFQLAEPADDTLNGLTCYIPTHAKYGSWNFIKFECEEQKCPHVIVKINEVYPEWPQK
jgi:hypothetical protein